MTRPINSYAELLEEKARLKQLLTEQKELVRQDMQQIKEELAPVRTAVRLMGRIVTKDRTNWFLTTAADRVIDVLMRRMVLSKAGWVTKLVIPFFMKNVSSHIIGDNKDKILSKLMSWFGKKKHKKGRKEKQEGQDLAAELMPENLYEEQED